MSDFSYKCGQFFFRCVFKIIAKVEMSGVEYLPREGGCLVMANHISHLDPPILGMRLARPIDYMADLPLFKIPIVGLLLKSWNAFAIDRTKVVDRGSIKTAMERLKAGRVVGIFPDRGLRYGEKSILGETPIPVGTAAIWQMAKVPVVPAVIIGTDQFYRWQNIFKRARAWVVYGEPLPPIDEKNETREQARDRLQEAMKKLYREMVEQYKISENELPRTAQERWAKS